MPKAGFWSIGGYEISFRKDGRWYADDEPVRNPQIARLFSEHVQSDGEGGWVIDLGIDRQRVTVEDTALVVVEVEGDPPAGLSVRANDGQTQELDCSTLEIGADNVLYCRLDRGSRGEIRARFHRAPYYRMAEFFEIDPGSGKAVIECRGRRYVVEGRH